MTATNEAVPIRPLATPSLAAQLQRRTALQHASARRAELAQLNEELRNGRRSLSAVMLNPPAAVAERMVWRILLDAGVTATAIGELNDDAITERVNLAAPLSMLSTRQRRWVVAQLAPTGG